MRKNITILVSLLLVAALISGCTPTVIERSSESKPPERTIAVNGVGNVYANPDIAYINIGVHTQNEDPKAALTDNTSQAQDVIDAIKSTGVKEEDIQTSNFNIYPSTQYGPTGETLGTVYMVDNTVYVTIRDLTKLGAMLEAVVSSGANNVNGIQFDIKDKDALASDARAKAVEDAHKQAQDIAKAAGVELDELMYVNVYYSGTTYPQYEGKGGGGGMSAPSLAVPVSAGKLVITAEVNMTYKIK
ncbi:MAG: SIMPL domain-containing protein [Anaerolineaceae bacterium]